VLEIEKKSGKKTTWKNLFFIYFYFSKRRKQFQIGLFSLFLAAAGLLWQAMGILRARVKFLVSFINQKTDGPDEKNREPEMSIYKIEINRREKWKYPFINK
jgi:hypothetical protein